MMHDTTVVGHQLICPDTPGALSNHNFAELGIPTAAELKTRSRARPNLARVTVCLRDDVHRQTGARPAPRKLATSTQRQRPNLYTQRQKELQKWYVSLRVRMVTDRTLSIFIRTRRAIAGADE